MQERNRIEYLDFAKGIAIISVLLGHMIDGYCWQIVSSYHNFLFFITAGYFVSNKDKMIVYIMKRVRSLLIPVVFAKSLYLIIQSCIFLFSKGINGAVIFLGIYIERRLGLNGTPVDNYQGVLWFFFALFFSSVILRVILKIRNNKLQYLCAILSFVTGIALARYFDFPPEITSGLAAVLYVFLGYQIRINNDMIKCFSIRYKVVISAVITVFSLIYLFLPFIHKVDFVLCDFMYVEDILGPIICVVFVLMLSQLSTRKKNYPASVLGEIGKASLYILIVHYCEMNTVDWMALNSDFKIPVACIILIRIVLVLSLGYGLSRINLLRKLFGQKPV